MRALLHLELRDGDGRLLAERHARNAVLRSGATLLARLFAARGNGISHVAVGSSDAPESEAFATTALQDATEVAVAADAFTIDEPDEVRRVVRVRVRTTLPAAAAVGTLREAALVSRAGAGDGEVSTLYNRVVFAPIDKGDDHELTLFWEIAFPFGDLQGLL